MQPEELMLEHPVNLDLVFLDASPNGARQIPAADQLLQEFILERCAIVRRVLRMEEGSERQEKQCKQEWCGFEFNN
jgi:hypothetical protein